MKKWFCLVLLILAALASYTPALAQDKTLYWQRYDVNLEVQPNGDMLVEESQEIVFTSGTFTFGFATIPMDYVEQIIDESVAEVTPQGELAYTSDSSSQYGFTTADEEGNREITWYFPPTRNTTKTYILRYRVIGGVRIYDG